MAATASLLHGFAYGEYLEGPHQRSLGFRLLAPAGPTPWADEVESLARRLQGVAYPDAWPATDLFCSVLLADGERLVAVARYGRTDHTPGRRRGGLELVGVVGPADMDVPSALALYRWLRQRQVDDLRNLGASLSMEEVRASAPPAETAGEPSPVLPVRLVQPRALLLTAMSPTEPDRHLGLLDGCGPGWQWLPLVGSDYPLPEVVQRGTLIAWTPSTASPVLPLSQPAPQPVVRSPLLKWGPAFAALLLLLLVANLWATLSLSRRLADTETSKAPPASTPMKPAEATADAERERFARGLYRLLVKRGAVTTKEQGRMTGAYEDLAAEDEALRVTTSEGKVAVAAVDGLTRRGAGQVEAAVRESLTGKGYDPELINRACSMVREKLAEESKK